MHFTLPSQKGRWAAVIWLSTPSRNSSPGVNVVQFNSTRLKGFDRLELSVSQNLVTDMNTEWTITVNGKSTAISTLDELRLRLVEAAEGRFSDVWLELPDGPILCMLRNDQRALLMFLRHGNGDPGFSTRNPASTEEPLMLEFTLSNGQVDECPAVWTYPLADIIPAIEYFFHTRERASWLTWHDDSAK